MTPGAATAKSGVFSTHDQLADHLRRGGIGDFEAQSDFATCLLPLLQALGWQRGTREIAEALPHFSNSLDLGELRDVLARLGFRTTGLKVSANDIDERLLPCLFVTSDGRALILTSRQGGFARIFDSAQYRRQTVEATSLKGTAYVVLPEAQAAEREPAAKANWIRGLLGRFDGLFARLAAITFALNIIALFVPLFIMVVYDQVISAGSLRVLPHLLLGITFVFIMESILRTLRARTIAYLGGRIEMLVASNVFGHILALPASLTEAAPLGNQVSRLREFDNIREIFTGPLITIIFDGPFAIIFLIAIAVLGGSLALVPIVMLGVFALAAAILLPRLRRSVKSSSQARAARHGFLVETITAMRTIRETNAQGRWLERYRDLSAEASYQHYLNSQVSFMFQTLSQAIMLMAGLAAIGLGVLRVLDGLMTVGALIATMALIWRVLMPLHSLFLTVSRFEQIKSSLQQINRLMRMPTEGANKKFATKTTERKYAGALNLNRVSFRYQPTAEPALLGINLDIKAGEVIALTGGNGAGKSTVLRLLLGLHEPQAGQISLDGMDIRQIEPGELRRAIAYVPQNSSMFHGSILQNLRLANPVAEMADVVAACRMAGALGDIEALPEGFETRIGDQNTASINSGLLQRISLARAYLKKAPVLLLDEAAQTLDEKGDAAFIRAIRAMKGETTVVMITHRPSHMRLADRVIVLSSGLLAIDGPPDAVLKRLYGAKG